MKRIGVIVAALLAILLILYVYYNKGRYEIVISPGVVGMKLDKNTGQVWIIEASFTPTTYGKEILVEKSN